MLPPIGREGRHRSSSLIWLRQKPRNLADLSVRKPTRPCKRTGAGASAAHVEHVAATDSVSAPGWSRITRLSVLPATAKATRAGKVRLD